MTFLNPLVLFGLITAAVPVLLHLLNLRKLRTVEFSTLTFLNGFSKRKSGTETAPVFLLIVRTLLVMFIILAFSATGTTRYIFGRDRNANTFHNRHHFRQRVHDAGRER